MLKRHVKTSLSRQKRESSGSSGRRLCRRHRPPRVRPLTGWPAASCQNRWKIDGKSMEKGEECEDLGENPTKLSWESAKVQLFARFFLPFATQTLFWLRPCPLLPLLPLLCPFENHINDPQWEQRLHPSSSSNETCIELCSEKWRIKREKWPDQGPEKLENPQFQSILSILHISTSFYHIELTMLGA